MKAPVESACCVKLITKCDSQHTHENRISGPEQYEAKARSVLTRRSCIRLRDCRTVWGSPKPGVDVHEISVVTGKRKRSDNGTRFPQVVGNHTTRKRTKYTLFYHRPLSLPVIF